MAIQIMMVIAAGGEGVSRGGSSSSIKIALNKDSNAADPQPAGCGAWLVSPMVIMHAGEKRWTSSP